MSKPIILVDGSSYLYRAFHAMPSLMNSSGFQTGAIYGIVNMLKSLINKYEPEYMAVIFDAKGKTFRDDLYDKYKANRPQMPPELAKQVEPIYKIINALGLPMLVIEGVEADDVIGTLAKKLEKQDKKTLISTGDKDLAQLVSDHVTLINTMSNTIFDEEEVKQKFGISPELIIDYLTLIGDTSDNIPGVPKVGPKTAVKWLNEFGSLDNIVLKADSIKGKVGENLRNSLDQIPLSKTLATIKLDVELDTVIDDLKISSPNKSMLEDCFKEFEFKTWLRELIGNDTKNKYENYKTIFSKQDFANLVKKLNQAKFVVFDTETTSLYAVEAELVGLSFAIEKSKSFYIPLTHTDSETEQLDRGYVLEQLKPFFENANIKKIGHNLKYDIEILANYEVSVNGVAFDTMLESYILDSASNSHNMDSAALKHLGWKTISYEDVAGKGAKQVTFDKVPVKEAAVYAAEDADVTLQLHDALWPKIKKEQGLSYIFEKIEMPLVSVLANIEMNGVLIDSEMLEKQSHDLEQRSAELESKIFEIAGSKFNINSPKQLQDILFNKLELPVLQKTPKGQPSTADGVLQELAHEYDLPKFIIEFRSLNKLITTYTKKLPQEVSSKTNRIHTYYNQTGTATGRLSSSDPNLQNIPIRTEEGRKIRRAFIAPPGKKLISADYSQIELRIMAHISEDKSLLDAFAKNLDIHSATAAEILNIPLEDVTYDERRKAKAVNFGLLYGMSAFGLAKQLDSSREVAQIYIDRYFARYPGVMNYMEETRTKAHDKGFVETLWGRRLYLSDINSSQVMRKKAAERTAINAPLQGTAADIIKLAMISLDEWCKTTSIDVKMIMQVHDELVFEVEEQAVDEVKEVVTQHMMGAAKLKVPLLVSIGSGDNWDSASG